ncbi:MAG: RHS repeat-associated core domain-containing protein, partial [Planctomycetaceae bacterium]
YDLHDRRISRSVDADSNGTFETVQRFAYDGSDLVLTFSGSTNRLTNRYLHGPGIDEILADEQISATGAATVIWSLADRLGTIRDLVQHSTTTGTTTLVNHIQYDTFGQLLSQTNPTQTPWFGYTGREWDAAAGLSYYRARWYDPRAGRFISEDPLSFAAGDINLNRYVGNGATLWVDPSGMAGQPSQDDMASAMMAPLAWAQANNAVPKGAKHCGNLVFEQVFAHQGWLDYMWGVSPDVLGMVAYDGSDDNAKDLAREIARLMKLKRGLAEIRESVQTGVVAATVLVQIGNEPLDIILSTHEAITNPSWRTIGGALLSTLPLVPGIAGKADDVVDLGKAE